MAEFYIKYMKKLNEKGAEFIKNETRRIESLMKDKKIKSKTRELEGRINILKSFKTNKKTKDEL